ncbi:uncharacterized protein [Euwallacea fornicatus]|uniref:uncharacterized protein n=1 Tax=Euwallacea fornicatus TaxID=995702 RepID=UPI0033906875
MKFDVFYGLLTRLTLVRVILSVPLLADVDIWRENVGNELGAVGNLGRLPRVLNFFPVPFVEECKANDGRRRGICMNTYECRIQEGKSYGFCALGFGVCCVFTATCGQEVVNNLTYFVSPNYPDLASDVSSCGIKVAKIESEVSQMRFDFIHFNLGQPNRTTGECEGDVFTIKASNSSREVTMCGLNSGQHVYLNVENSEHVEISVNLDKKAVRRFWEVVITQIPFTEQAPPECLQFHTGSSGVVQTFNFADNGRHLADQDYNICIRQEEGFCSIAYEPCYENAFRIAPNNIGGVDFNVAEEGSGDDDLDAVSRNIGLCNDKIVLPCDSDDLLMPGFLGLAPGSCSLEHCGPSLCPSGTSPCRIESSVQPFNIGVHFGPSATDTSPEDNLGMCLSYEQIPCEELNSR